MTRVNLVDPLHLADQHLFAEWREIKMVPAALRRSLKTRPAAYIKSGIPKLYTLNAGHVTFFYDKMTWLADRYEVLTAELHNREYNITESSINDIFFVGIPFDFVQPTKWVPGKQELSINIDRINLRISERPEWYRYLGNPMPPEFFVDLYNSQLDAIAC